MNILFHSNQLGIRGTEAHMFDLALGCQDIGDKCFIAARADKPQDTFEKFSARFPVLLYKNFDLVNDLIKVEKIDWLYAIKGGRKDGVESKFCKNFMHVVFQRNEPHGDRYVFISEWLAKTCGYHKQEDFLPFVVELPDIENDMRRVLKIPPTHVVYGRHGGEDEFNIPYVHQAIKEALETTPDIWFLFLNTKHFIEHERVLYLEKMWSTTSIRKFINTCDYMIHARVNGESFGLAIAQFLYCNKPVITWADGIDKNHLEMCSDKGIYYQSGKELKEILRELPRNMGQRDVTSRVSEFTSDKVVSKFKQLLI